MISKDVKQLTELGVSTDVREVSSSNFENSGFAEFGGVSTPVGNSIDLVDLLNEPESLVCVKFY